MQTIIINGHLGQDPEIVVAGSATVTKISVAVKQSRKSADGTYPTKWWKCECWGPYGENLAKYAKKGSSIVLNGTLEFQTYTDKDGVEKESMKIRISEYSLMSNGRSTEEVETLAASRPSTTVSSKTADLPF